MLEVLPFLVAVLVSLFIGWALALVNRLEEKKRDQAAVAFAMQHYPEAPEPAAIVASVLCKQLGVNASQLRPDIHFNEGLGVDEWAEWVEIHLALEEAFRVRLDPEEDIQLETVNDLVSYVTREVSRAEAS